MSQSGYVLAGNLLTGEDSGHDQVKDTGLAVHYAAVVRSSGSTDMHPVTTMKSAL